MNQRLMFKFTRNKVGLTDRAVSRLTISCSGRSHTHPRNRVSCTASIAHHNLPETRFLPQPRNRVALIPSFFLANSPKNPVSSLYTHTTICVSAARWAATATRNA